MTLAIAEVQGRIAAIQARFAVASAPVSGVGGRMGEVKSSDFDAMLQGFNQLPNMSRQGPSGADIVAKAREYLGIDYVFGSADPSKGLDCSGLVQEVYEQFGIQLPRVSRDQARAGTKVDSLADAQPGDLIAFNTPVDHIAIYIGNGKTIEAPHTGDVVRVRDIGNRDVTAIRRVLPDVSAAPTSTSTFNPALYRSTVSGVSFTYPGPNRTSIATDRDDTITRLTQSRIATPTEYADLFASVGEKYGIDPALLASLARTESNFRPNAVSSAGAIGMMQFMPSTAAGMGVNPSDPASAVDGTARLLLGHKEAFGSWELALAAYQSGAGNVRRQGGMPESSTTRNYVNKIINLWSEARS
jgi:hypothetical protein